MQVASKEMQLFEKNVKKLLDSSNLARYDIKVIARGVRKEFLQSVKKFLTKHSLRDILNKLFRKKRH